MVTMASGIVGNAAWDALRRLVSHLGKEVLGWLHRRFGAPQGGFQVEVDAFVEMTGPTVARAAGSDDESLLVPVFAILALLAQAALVFAVIWLLVAD
jgi:hypothetical protein